MMPLLRSIDRRTVSAAAPAWTSAPLARWSWWMASPWSTTSAPPVAPAWRCARWRRSSSSGQQADGSDAGDRGQRKGVWVWVEQFDGAGAEHLLGDDGAGAQVWPTKLGDAADGLRAGRGRQATSPRRPSPMAPTASSWRMTPRCASIAPSPMRQVLVSLVRAISARDLSAWAPARAGATWPARWRPSSTPA